MPYYLPEGVEFFPHPYYSDEEGLLAIGGNLTPETLLMAYQWGIFPWTSEDQPLLWWSTHPRCVLLPSQIKISKSMRSILNSPDWRWTMDTQFPEVIHRCKEKNRKGQEGTWIFTELEEAFIELHHRGYAHSVEVWYQDEMVAGLYGLCLGNIFFGESMFTDISNGSKYGFINLVKWLEQRGCTMIDCQQETAHLISMGATMISAEAFHKSLKKNIFAPTNRGSWTKQASDPN